MTTHTMTKSTCDRCGAEAQQYMNDGTEVELPFRWVHIRRDAGNDADVMDLCVDCGLSFEAWRTKVAEERAA